MLLQLTPAPSNVTAACQVPHKHQHNWHHLLCLTATTMSTCLDYEDTVDASVMISADGVGIVFSADDVVLSSDGVF